MRRLSLLCCVVLFATTALSAQTREAWNAPSDIKPGVAGAITGAVTGIDSKAGTIELVVDGDVSGTPVHVKTDAKTTFADFGAPGEKASGAAGIALLKEGDRIEARGKGAADSTVAASEIRLRGRDVVPPAPVQSSTAPAEPAPRKVIAPLSDRVEGTVRSVDAADARLVVETDDKSLITVYGNEETPVNFRGSVYSIGNVEVGDRVLVRLDRPGGKDAKVVGIDVLSSVSHQGGNVSAPPSAPRERPAPPPQAATGELAVVEIEGVIVQGLDNSQEMKVRDESSNEVVTVWTDEELVLDADHPSRAGQLVEGQAVTIRAFRIGDRLVAQVISVGD